MKVSTPSTTKKTLLIFLEENLHERWLFFGTIFLWVAGMIMQKLLMPLILAHAFDRLIRLGTTNSLQWSAFTTDVLLFIGLAVAAQFSIDGGLLVLSKMETKVTPQLHQKIYNKLLSQTMSFHANNFSGALVTQTNRFVNAYVAITDAFVISILQLVVLILLSAVVIFFYSPLIALCMVIWSVSFIGLNIRLTKKRIRYSRIASEADTVLTGHLADSVSNVSAIKAFAAETRESHRYDVLAKDRATKKYDYWIQAVKNDAVFGVMMSILQVAVLLLSIYLIKNQAITVGTLILSQVYITQIIANLWGLSNVARNIEQNLSDAAEMTEILQLDPAVEDPADVKTLEVKNGGISFRAVDFHYPEDKEMYLFKDLDLEIKPGEKIGLVGHSGGGKTTITKLLLRFMDIQGGQILIDDQNIADTTQTDLRSHIAYVPQEPLLFHRSIYENISYGRQRATMTEIVKAAKVAHADEFIQKLPSGYDTLVGERGVKLSGGQRQRIAIARAMLKNAPILVLDEATSALDSESEVLIQDALWKLMEKRTAIVIAHRLSTIQKMDRIVVLEEGKILEQGTHKQLLKHKGKYADLWAHQSGGFLED